MNEFFTTNGRFPRSTFWIYQTVIFGVFVLLGMIVDFVPLPETVQGILGLIVLPFLFVGIIVQIKRWHDRDKSGWWVLINFIPVIGNLWTLIECGFLQGTEGENRFGPDPLAKPMTPAA